VVDRVLVLVFAVAAIGFGFTHLHAQRQCDSVSRALTVSLLLNRVPPGGLDPLLKKMTDNCRENASIEGTSLAMAARGQRARAIALANVVIRREPDSEDGYVALAEALPTSDPRRARAVRRLHELNPRGVLPPLQTAPPLTTTR
jgi:hypothetical protein